MAKVLLVEDVEIVRSILRRFLESEGHVVTECGGGVAASRLAEAETFDVVVTDLWMKAGDGVQFIRAQSASGRAKSIIAMTGGNPSASRTQSVEAAQRAGAAHVLIKPVTKTDILSAVDMALGHLA